jgi:N-acetylmuramoyl-L-alanine amidase CwlA
MAAHGLSPNDLWRHYDVTGKICPKYYVDRPDEWDAFRASI